MFRSHAVTLTSPLMLLIDTRTFGVAAWVRSSGAAIELGAAQIELRQAIAQAPDSSALQRLLERTEQQQSRLRQLGHDAG